MAYVEKSPNQPLFLDLGHLIVDGEQPPDIIVSKIAPRLDWRMLRTRAGLVCHSVAEAVFLLRLI